MVLSAQIDNLKMSLGNQGGWQGNALFGKIDSHGTDN